VRDNLDKPNLLNGLCQIWLRMATKLREADLAHCDLQHGNVLLVPGDKANALGVRLVDYDGMCVPALTLLKSIEVGHPNYQHPQRLKEGIYSPEVDRFSHLVIYTALRGLMAGGKALWQKHDNGDNLLFKQTDLAQPNRSPVFADLLRMNDPEVKKLTTVLVDAAKKPLDAPRVGEDWVGRPAATPVSRPVAAKPRPAGRSAFAAMTEGPAAPAAPRRRKRSSFMPMLGALLVLAVGGGVGFFIWQDRQA